MGVQTALDAVTGAPAIVDAMRLADDLAFEASRDPGLRTVRVLAQAFQGDDELTAIAATHALAGVFDAGAAKLLVRLLSDEREFLREHAAWALASGLPRADAMGALLRLVTDGGFTGMLAQRTLEQWAESNAEPLVVGVEGALLGVREPAARARLVETLGLVRDPIATAALVRVATDAAEPEPVRVAAIAALGDRPASLEPLAELERLADGDGLLADVARLALADLAQPAPDAATRTARSGITVAQLFLHADIDPALSAAGAGDNGGIATLLVRLGDALAASPDAGIRRVLTLSRGSARQAVVDLDALREDAAGHVYGRIPLLHDPVPSAAAWPFRVPAERAIRRVLRAAGRADALHLRMADVGTLAAVEAARELGIPVVFSLAPDPHGVIESLDRAGRLTRENFGRTDLAEHFWFRARLVQRVAANAAHTVLFPRPRLEEDLLRLVGVDLTAHAERHTIVPEGVDFATIEGAVAEAVGHADGGAPTPAIAELRDLVADLAPERRGLPLVISVGRLHRVKGMAALVEAWAGSGLASRANLLIVGGDLRHPSPDEREQLDRIDACVPPADRAAAGLILAGHRPNGVTARWMAAARVGLPDLAAPGGVYACASMKEEFGLAILEAMATGLFVVAPDGGGPATYVDDGVTGILTATSEPDRLRAALSAALDTAGGEAAAGDDSRADLSRATVRAEFTIERMSQALAGVYDGVARAEAELLRRAEAVA